MVAPDGASTNSAAGPPRERDEFTALGRQLSMILLECAASGALPRSASAARSAWERLHAAAAICTWELRCSRFALSVR